jgi:hypothetical protein
MPTAFAAIEARLGAATTRAFSNASMVLPLGASVDGVFDRARAVAGLGGMGMQTRDITFVCRTAHLVEPVARDVLVSIAGEPYRVRAVTQLLELGDTEIVLEEQA